VYNWGMEGLGWPLFSGSFALAVVGMADLIVSATLGMIAGEIFQAFNKPPVGFRATSIPGKIVFRFANEEFAEEFKKMNESLEVEKFSLF
jgi:hypothetical protein